MYCIPGSPFVSGAGYEELKAQCEEDGALWEDPDFPAEDASLYYENCPVEGDIVWKRPTVSCDAKQGLSACQDD